MLDSSSDEDDDVKALLSARSAAAAAAANAAPLPAVLAPVPLQPAVTAPVAPVAPAPVAPLAPGPAVTAAPAATQVPSLPCLMLCSLPFSSDLSGCSVVPPFRESIKVHLRERYCRRSCSQHWSAGLAFVGYFDQGVFLVRSFSMRNNVDCVTKRSGGCKRGGGCAGGGASSGR
jgi:hypothetical protein